MITKYNIGLKVKGYAMKRIYIDANDEESNKKHINEVSLINCLIKFKINF